MAFALADTRPGVVLLRNSTPEQKDNARSIKAEATARALLEQQGIAVGAVLDEQGTSGKDLSKRPVAQKLVDDLEAGKWAALAVIETSRTSRDPDGVDQRIFKRACRRGRALLLTPNRAFDFRKDADDLQYEIESVFNAAEWRKLRKRTWEGNIERARLLPVFFGFAPFGYRKTAATYTIRGTARTAQVLEKDEDQTALMLAIGKAMDEEDGLNAVAWRLNREGHLQPNGSRWYWSQVERVLDKPVYHGRWVYGEYRQADDLWEIEQVSDIEHDLPELAWYTEERVAGWRRRMKGKRGAIRVRPQGWPHPLLGVLRCCYCHQPMIAQGARGYACGLRRDGGCRGQNLSSKQADGAVRTLLADVLPKLADLTREVHAILDSDTRPDLAAELRHLDRQISARFELALEWKEKQIEPPTDFYTKQDDLQQQRQKLVEQLAHTDRIEFERRRQLAQLAQFDDPEQVLDLYDRTMSTSEQQQFLGYLFAWVEVQANGGRGNRAHAWVKDYVSTFPNSVSGSGLWTSWLNRFDEITLPTVGAA